MKILSTFSLVLLFSVSGFAEAQPGRAIDIDGIGYVQVPNFSSLDGANDITLEAWVYLKSDAAEWDRILDADSGVSGANQQPRFMMGFGMNNRIRFRINDYGQYQYLFGMESISAVPTSQWAHIACVRSSGNMRIYINGVQDANVGYFTNPIQTFANNPDLSIGSITGYLGCGGPCSYLPGMVDEVRIWSRALSEAEIRHKMTERLAGAVPGLVAYYRMDEGTDNTCPGGQDVCDASGNGNHGVKF
ncbi:MAG: LamG domain-containing protein [Bacteroidetes bacterium]|jgi:hypothetical protein|nr:LamG domain-containing protein [Bacteroidota bacterium]